MTLCQIDGAASKKDWQKGIDKGNEMAMRHVRKPTCGEPRQDNTHNAPKAAGELVDAQSRDKPKNDQRGNHDQRLSVH
jgi:hypothetical protein